jgi:capsular polysaccharide transport system permease protein
MDSTGAPPLPKSRPVTTEARSFPTLRNIAALILREMSTRYGRTPGGFVWAIAEPLGAIILLSVGFSLIVRSPSLGTSFILFFATGFVPLNLYMTLSIPVARSLLFSKQLLKYPAVGWIDAILARLILNTLTNVLFAIILFLIVMTAVDTRTVLDFTPIVEAVALTILLGFGVGTLNCTLFGLFPVWEQIWAILTRPLFLASAVFYIYEDLPRAAQDILWYNPLVHITGLMRTGFYPTYSPTYINVTYVLFFAITLVALGLLLTRRFQADILNR